MLAVLIPAVEEATRSEPHEYVGNITSSKEHEPTVRTTMVNGPGLRSHVIVRRLPIVYIPRLNCTLSEV